MRHLRLIMGSIAFLFGMAMHASVGSSFTIGKLNVAANLDFGIFTNRFVLSFVTRSVIRISILLFLLLLFLQEHVTTAQNTNTKTIKGLTFFPINIFISVAIASCLQFFKFSYSILLSFTDKCVIIHILSRVCKSEKYGTIYQADTNRL